MNYQDIKRLQKEYELDEMQLLINSGEVWKFEGSFGRRAMELLESGACMLPKSRKSDYYGNVIPSRDDLKPGSKGTYQNSRDFWLNIDEYPSHVMNAFLKSNSNLH